MNDDLHARVLTLAALAALGVGLALVGNATGAGGPVTDPDPASEIAVSGSNVSVSDGDREVAVVENMTNVESVRIESAEQGGYRIETERDSPLSVAERQRAKTIALENESVRRHLGGSNGTELAVEPIRKLTADSFRSIDVSVQVTSEANTSNQSGAMFTLSTNGSSVDREEGSVTIDRDRRYVNNRAAVEIRDHSTDEPRFTAVIDLANGTVVETTDWSEI